MSKWKIAGIVLVALVVIAAVAGGGDSDSPPQVEVKKEEMPTTGSTLQSGEFAVTLQKWYVASRVNTGNPFASLKPEQGHRYLVIRTSFKNTGTDSNTIWGSGEVYIDVEGKRYKYDKSETILLDGWGNLLESINPMVTKTTNLVFKIPADIKGDLYWSAGQSWSDSTFYLGTL